MDNYYGYFGGDNCAEEPRAATGTGTAINYNGTYCLHRLPCGYCRIMQGPCPMYSGTNIQPSWNEATCKTEADT